VPDRRGIENNGVRRASRQAGRQTGSISGYLDTLLYLFQVVALWVRTIEWEGLLLLLHERGVYQLLSCSGKKKERDIPHPKFKRQLNIPSRSALRVGFIVVVVRRFYM
jgi:hypothetical protein